MILHPPGPHASVCGNHYAPAHTSSQEPVVCISSSCALFMFANFPNIHYNECIFTFVFLPKSKPISASYSLCHLDKSFNASDLRNLEVQVGRCWFCRVETLQRRTGSSKSRSLLYRSAEQTRAWLPVTSQFLPSEPDSISSVYAMTLANR